MSLYGCPFNGKSCINCNYNINKQFREVNCINQNVMQQNYSSGLLQNRIIKYWEYNYPYSKIIEPEKKKSVYKSFEYQFSPIPFLVKV